jgi:hypothetical protein
MKGADTIIKMRRAGFRPHSVFIWDIDWPVVAPAWDEDLIRMDVCTHGDSISALDMRFLVGIPVQVYGEKIDRVRLLGNQCRKAGAQSVVLQCAHRGAFWDAKESKWQTF